jgi:hypothetical protein
MYRRNVALRKYQTSGSIGKFVTTITVLCSVGLKLSFLIAFVMLAWLPLMLWLLISELLMLGTTRDETSAESMKLIPPVVYKALHSTATTKRSRRSFLRSWAGRTHGDEDES